MTSHDPAITRVFKLGHIRQDLHDQLQRDPSVEFCEGDLATGLAFGPDVVVYALEDLSNLSTQSLERVAQVFSRPIVLWGAKGKLKNMKESLEAGVVDILASDAVYEQLHFSIAKARQLHPRMEVKEYKAIKARTISLYGAKGGVGTTTMAANLGAVYAKQGLATLIIDVDLQFGDLAFSFGVKPDESLLDFLFRTGGELDADKIRGCVMKITDNLDILPAPAWPEDAELVQEERFRTILEAVRNTYDVIIFDTPCQLDAITLTALEFSDKICLVSNKQAASIKSTMIANGTLEKLTMTGTRMIIMNGGPGKINDLKNEFPVSHALPEDKALAKLSENGHIAAFKSGKNVWLKELSTLADTLHA